MKTITGGEIKRLMKEQEKILMYLEYKLNASDMKKVCRLIDIEVLLENNSNQ